MVGLTKEYLKRQVVVDLFNGFKTGIVAICFHDYRKKIDLFISKKVGNFVK